MSRLSSDQCQSLKSVINRGGIIAYPTEAVYGLGCDPFNAQAVARLVKLKQRDPNKGLILIADTWSRLEDLVLAIPSARQTEINQSWPGPVTWVFEASDRVPSWIMSPDQRIACRVTAHPIAAEICQCVQQAIVSTSANMSGEPPLRSAAQVEMVFAGQLDYIVPGSLGDLEQPTTIRDAKTGKTLR